MKDKKTARSISIFLTIVISILTTAQLIISPDYVSETVLPDYFFTYVFIFMTLFSLITTIKITKATYIYHVAILLFIGIVILYDTYGYFEVYGELIVLMGLLVARTYGMVAKNFSRLFLGLLLVSMILKVYRIYQTGNFNLNYTISYLILMGFINFFFFKVMTSAEERQKTEARHICNRWQKEQVYTEIGKTVFSTFIHDYNIMDSYTGLKQAKIHIDNGNNERAHRMIDLVMEMLLEDDQRVKSVRDRVIISRQTKPEAIEVSRFIHNLIKRLQMSRSAGLTQLQYTDNLNDNSRIMAVPIDIVGIIENILKNAQEAVKELSDEGKIELLLSGNSRKIILQIINNGPPIPWAQKDGKVTPGDFRPGLTTKKNGTGWGMYATVNRIEENRGQLTITSNSEKTEFKVEFPRLKRKVNHE